MSRFLKDCLDFWPFGMFHKCCHFGYFLSLCHQYNNFDCLPLDCFQFLVLANLYFSTHFTMYKRTMNLCILSTSYWINLIYQGQSRHNNACPNCPLDIDRWIGKYFDNDLTKLLLYKPIIILQQLHNIFIEWHV